MEKRVTPALTARSIRVRLGKVYFEGNRLKVAFIVSNPTSDTIRVRSVVGEVYVNGNKLGNVESFETVDILPNAKTTLNVEVRIMALQLVKTVEQLTQKKLAIEIGFTGTLNINNRPTPMQIVDKII